MIALPMTCILLNEALGGAIVDSAIPAFYSAIFIFGTYLHSVSIIVLVVTLALILIALNYWTFVYVPARKAHQKRKDKMRRIYHESLTLSKLNNTMKRDKNDKKENNIRKNEMVKSSPNLRKKMSLSIYCNKVLNIIKRSIQHAITLLSFRRMRHMKSVAAKKVWCGMNRSLAFQGIVGQDSILEFPSQLNSPKNKLLKFTRRLSSISIPDGVTNMLSSLNENRIENNPNPHKIDRKKPVSILSSLSMSSENSNNNQLNNYTKDNNNNNNNNNENDNDCDIDATQCDPIVNRLAYSEGRKRRKLRPLILFDSNEVLSELRSRLAICNTNNINNNINMNNNTTNNYPDFYNRNNANNNSNNNINNNNNNSIDRNSINSINSINNSNTSTPGHLDITETVLFTELKRILQIYYPDGVALSETEKAEACESYNNWKQSINEHFSVVLIKLKPVRVRIISFHAFEEWFTRDILNVIRNNLSDRLLDNSLRHSPNIKRRLNMAAKNASTTHIITSPSSPNAGQLYMKRLKVVTPQDIMIRNSINLEQSLSYDIIQYNDEHKSYTGKI